MCSEFINSVSHSLELTPLVPENPGPVSAPSTSQNQVMFLSFQHHPSWNGEGNLCDTLFQYIFGRHKNLSISQSFKNENIITSWCINHIHFTLTPNLFVVVGCGYWFDFFTVLISAAASLKQSLVTSQNSLINQSYSRALYFILLCSFSLCI